jgi:hypothetical protein
VERILDRHVKAISKQLFGVSTEAPTHSAFEAWQGEASKVLPSPRPSQCEVRKHGVSAIIQ